MINLSKASFLMVFLFLSLGCQPYDRVAGAERIQRELNLEGSEVTFHAWCTVSMSMPGRGEAGGQSCIFVESKTEIAFLTNQPPVRIPVKQIEKVGLKKFGKNRQIQMYVGGVVVAFSLCRDDNKGMVNAAATESVYESIANMGIQTFEPEEFIMDPTPIIIVI